MMCFDEWSSCILSNCGHYNSKPMKHATNSVGNFKLHHRQGIGIVELECHSGRIDRIERFRADIQRDDSEYLFLLVQKSGEVGIAHNGREERLMPGDSLLMDSTRAAELRFDGKAVSMMSVHLPRGICLEGRAHSLATGQRVARAHPLSASLLNLLFDDGQQESQTDYLFDFVALMFRNHEQPANAAGFRDRHGRFRYICDRIERHLPDASFSIEQLAALVHMSKRQLQRDFSDNGTTFTRLLNERRMKLVASHLGRSARMNQRPAISDLAYRAGFSDLSHFNRGFRQFYGTTPSDYHADCRSRRFDH